MFTVAVLLVKLKNEVLKLLKPRGGVAEAEAVICTLVMSPLGVAIFKLVPVSVRDCEMYGLDPETREGK